MTKKIILILSILLIPYTSYAQENLINKLFIEGKIEEVINKSKDLLKADPHNALNNFTLGGGLEMKKKFNEALPYFEKSLKYSKNDSFITEITLSHLGTTYYGIGKYKESKESFNKVINNSSNKSLLSYSLRYSKLFGLSNDYKNWKEVTSEHFIFHFQEQTKVKDIKEFINEREKAFSIINSFFKIKKFPKKIDFFVWNSNEDSQKIINLNASFSKPEYCLIHSNYDQSLGHEMTHVIANFIDQESINTPFVTEGLAIYFDQDLKDKATLAKNRIKTAAKKHHVFKTTLKELWEENWEEYQKKYNNPKIPFHVITDPMSAGFIGFLIDKKGREKFLELYKNQTYENAIKIYGEKGLTSIIENYENYVYDRKKS